MFVQTASKNGEDECWEGGLAWGVSPPCFRCVYLCCLYVEKRAGWIDGYLAALGFSICFAIAALAGGCVELLFLLRISTHRLDSSKKFWGKGIVGMHTFVGYLGLVGWW